MDRFETLRAAILEIRNACVTHFDHGSRLAEGQGAQFESIIENRDGLVAGDHQLQPARARALVVRQGQASAGPRARSGAGILIRNAHAKWPDAQLMRQLSGVTRNCRRLPSLEPFTGRCYGAAPL